MKTIAFLLLFMWFGNNVVASPVTTNTYGPIENGEKLWNIAAKIRPDSSISRYQAMLALLKANPDAFEISCNLNTLKIGQTLQIPSRADMQALSPKQAVNEFYRQNQEWKTYRRKQQPIVCPSSVKLSFLPQIESPISQPEEAPITQTTTNVTITAPPPSSVTSTVKTTPPISTTENKTPNISNDNTEQLPTPSTPSITPPGPPTSASTASAPTTTSRSRSTPSPSPAASVLAMVDWGDARCPLGAFSRRAVPVYTVVNHNGTVIRNTVPRGVE